MHGHSKQRTEKFVKEARALQPALLIIEGTRVDQSDPVTEPDVHQAAGEVVRQAAGVVIADFTARNIERLRTFRDIATARDRRLVVTTKDAYMLEHLHVIDPNIPHPASEGLAILDEPLGTVPSWENASSERKLAMSSRRPPAMLFIAGIWALPPTRDTEMPTSTAGRTPAKNRLGCR